jgi:dolichyl-diphosphooligosaccharide--protein glycosyltransferase
MIPFTAVIIYKIALFFGFNITMLTACYLTPAIFGTLTVFVIYKLGAVLHSKRTGIFAAFFVAMATGFISRSIAGFFDNECIGIFLMFLIFYFFVKGLTKDSMVNNVLAGISLGLLSITWGAYKYAWAILALYALLMIVLRKFSRRLFSSYSVTILVGTIIFTFVPRNALKRILNTEIVITLQSIAVMLLIIV